MTPLLSSPLADIDGVAHGFFGRRGGVSKGIFASLNCGYGSNDDPAAVRENRTRVAQHLGTSEERLITVYQIHSPNVVTVEAPWVRADAPQADAMVTRATGIALGVLAADCAPVLFADAEAGVIGSAHAGWKGAHDGVIEATVDAMEALGARRGRVCAVIGPCIGQASYEVGPEFYARFVDADEASRAYFRASTRADHWQFDLPRYAFDRLAASGLGHVVSLNVCTYAHADDYFSFRRATHRSEPEYGRNLSAIILKP
jgi:YfiH family protein